MIRGPQYKCSPELLIADLYQQLRQISLEYETWLQQKNVSAKSAADIYLTFSLVPRFIPRLSVDIADGYFKEKLYEFGHSEKDWTADQLARLVVLLKASEFGELKFSEIIKMLLSTADYQEQICIYKSLMFLPFHEFFVERAVDGLRSNIGDVFDSIAFNNKYPYCFFEETAWNQMVLKALFIQKPLNEIIGLDERTNKNLSNIAIDLAHERWAAGRSVSPDLWRLTEKFLDEENVKDIEKLLKGTETEKQVANHLCRISEIPVLKALVDAEDCIDFDWERIK